MEETAMQATQPDDLPPLPVRPPDGHKGTFGTVCVVGGQCADARVMLGGPAFSALAALRCGTGLAILAVPEPMMFAALTVAPSATGLALPVDDDGAFQPSAVATVLDQYLTQVNCLAVGPGLGADVPQQQMVMPLVHQERVPLVIDADGLNALAAVPEFQLDFHASAVLTPHPGEFRRLASAVGIELPLESPQQRIDAAGQLAQRLGCIVVLKGAGTVITDGLKSYVNPTGNVALATAGTGDMLTGLIAGLIAQFYAPRNDSTNNLSLLDCARWGVYLHGLAADQWAQQNGTSGLLAGDLLLELHRIMQEYRS